MIDNLVSIIMPAFNAERYISKAIQSVLRQTYKEWELIIVDDRSSDKTRDILADFAAENPRIIIDYLDHNGGVANARNHGINRARGRYLAFLDSDDEWMPTKIEHQIAAMERVGAAFSCTWYQRFKDTDAVLGVIKTKKKLTYLDLLLTNDIGCSTVMLDLSLIGKHFFKQIGHEDYALWLEIIKTIPYAFGLPEVLVRYRVLSESTSSNKLKAARSQWLIYRQHEQLSFLKSVFFFTCYIVFAIKKRVPIRHRSQSMNYELDV